MTFRRQANTHNAQKEQKYAIDSPKLARLPEAEGMLSFSSSGLLVFLLLFEVSLFSVVMQSLEVFSALVPLVILLISVFEVLLLSWVCRGTENNFK